MKRRYFVCLVIINSFVSCALSQETNEGPIVINEACPAPGNVVIEGSGGSLSCGCQPGLDQIGTGQPASAGSPNSAVCSLDWNDGGVVVIPPRPPGPGGPGGGGSGPKPICTPEQLQTKMNDAQTQHRLCWTRAYRNVKNMGVQAVYTGLGGLLVNSAGSVFTPGTAVAGVGATWIATVVNQVVKMDEAQSCDEDFCEAIKRTVRDCGYPDANSLGGPTDMCSPQSLQHKKNFKPMPINTGNKVKEKK
jgi:hypothetical protein